MNSTMVIARRELTEKRFVFVAAAAFLALALIVPFLPGVHAGERVGALVVGSLSLATALTIGLAAILGATIVGRELSDGRLSFYFSKPVPGTSIWFGKIVASTLMILACFAIVGFPALLAGGASTVRTWTNPPRDALFVIEWILSAAAALFLVSHVIGTFVRSRSTWIVFDFIAAAVCGTAIWLLVRPLLQGFALELAQRVAVILSVYTGAAIVAAGAWQVARGRTDRKRSHMELSRFLWMSLGCGLLVAAAFVAWVTSVSPRDVITDFAEQSSTDWAFIGGRAQNRMDYHAAFLYNIDNGSSVRIPTLRSWWGSSFSADGKLAYWVVPIGGGPSDLWIARLDTPNPRPVQTRITLNQPSFFNVSQDGSRFVSIDRQGILAIYDAGSGDSLGSARIPAGNYWFGYFVRPDVVRVFANTPKQPTLIFEYDVVRKTLAATGQLPKPAFRLNQERTMTLLVSGSAIEVRDARTGAVQHAIPGRFSSVKFLRGGRIAAIDRDRGALRIFSGDGSALRDISLPDVKSDFISDAGPGIVVVAMPRARCAVVDIDRGAVVRVEEGIRPATFGNAGTQLLCYTREGLVAWNPATNEKRVISKLS